MNTVSDKGVSRSQEAAVRKPLLRAEHSFANVILRIRFARLGDEFLFLVGAILRPEQGPDPDEHAEGD